MSATLKFDVVANGRAARSELARTRSEVDRFGATGERTASQLGRSESRVRKFLGTMGKAAVLGVAAAGVAVGKFAIDSINAASRTQQAFGALESVFGDNADRVERWANRAATSVGLARSEYAELASVIGAGLKNQGVENYAKQTDRLIRIGADLAATFGGTTKDAVEALGSTLRGETDPIERYGVTIKQADINARLAAKGQDKLEGAALRQAEAMARLELITEQTSTAQGQFGRESDTLAGKQQRLRARFENLKDTLGQKLLPVAERVTGWLLGVIEGSNKAGEALRRWGRKAVEVAGWIDREVIGPTRDLAKAGGEVASAFDRGRAKTEAYRRELAKTEGLTAKLGMPGGSFMQHVKLLNSTVPAAWEVAAEKIGEWVGLLETAIALADQAAGKLYDMRDALLSLPGKALGNALSLGRSADGDGVYPGLGRAYGAGLIGAGGGSPVVEVSSRPSVTIDIDSDALARLFRIIVRDELAKVSTSRRTLT